MSDQQQSTSTADQTGPLPAAEIVARRKALGLRQADLAALLPVSLRTLEGWEQGRPAPAYLERALSDLERELEDGQH